MKPFESLIIAALEIASGRTTLFNQLAPSQHFRPSKDPTRIHQETQISSQHVLASAAIPLLFPSRKIGDRFYCDGGLRFNTPISPAIRSGARRMVIVPVVYDIIDDNIDEMTQRYPNPLFLIGKLANALLLESGAL